MDAELRDATTMRELWRRRAARSPDRPFLHAEARTYSYGEVAEWASRYASGLAALGVGLGSRVMVGMGNRPNTLATHLAITQLGGVLIPLQGGLTFAELAYQIRHSESSILVAEGQVAETVLPRLDELDSVSTVVTEVPCRNDRVLSRTLEALAEHPPLPWTDLAGHDEFSPALVLYTSGSTGRPKGVVLPAGSPRSVGEAFNDRFGFGPEDNYFLPLTMSHAIGAVVAPAMAITAGGSVTLVDRFSPRSFWRQVAESGATVTILFPAHLNLLLETEEEAPESGQSRLRLIITHRWMPDFRARFGVELALVWGMTETGALSTGGRPGERGDAESFVGRPMIGVQVEIRDHTRHPLPAGEVGEISLHHRHAMLEYLKDQEATNSTLVHGWVQSGDYGSLDVQGNLHFLGRQKNMIKRSGENISPEEVESVLSTLPEVTEVLVFGVPDPIRSEEVAAVMVVRPGTQPADVLQRAGEQLVRWKLPRYVAMTEKPLPRLGNGKIDRSAIRRGFHTGTAFDREKG